MKIGDRVFVRGYVDEIRKDTVIIRNNGGYFGTIPSEVITGELPSARPEPKRGRWIYKTDLITAPTGYWECSECKEGRLLYEENFCPHCGAEMEVTE
jgi:hypothetical protein